MRAEPVLRRTASVFGVLLLVAMLSGALLMICCVAPTERTMGHAQRIVYVHVAVAWLGLLGLPAMAGCVHARIRHRRRGLGLSRRGPLVACLR